jgi:anti-sigma regulatory factor (Ser/Thr protein kinase)
MRIPDRETADLVADWLTSVAAALRLPASEARLAVAAARTFADNALHHAPKGADPSLLSICRAREPNDLQVVMLSPGVPNVAREQTDEYLRDLVARSRSHLGGLSSLFTLARRRGLDVSLRVAVANGRVYGRTGGVSRVRYEPYPALLPAFVASLEIHIGSTIRPSG